MVDCRKVGEQIKEYLDHELDEATIKKIEEHLELCRMCFDVSEFEKLLKENCKKKTDKPCPEQLKNRIRDIIDRF